MKKNTPIAELRRGDKIYIDYGGRCKVKIVNNRPEIKKMVVKMWYIPFFGLALFGDTQTLNYNDYNFNNYSLYNIFN